MVRLADPWVSGNDRMLQSIYLDTSYLNTLARAAGSDRKSYISFLDAWQEHHWQLALSSNHLHELRRHAGNEARRDRYSLLRDLGAIRTDFAGELPRFPWFGSFEEREVVSLLWRAGYLSFRFG